MHEQACCPRQGGFTEVCSGQGGEKGAYLLKVAGIVNSFLSPCVSWVSSSAISGFCAAEISGPSAWTEPLMFHFPPCTGVSRCVGILLEIQDMA